MARGGNSWKERKFEKEKEKSESTGDLILRGKGGYCTNRGQLEFACACLVDVRCGWDDIGRGDEDWMRGQDEIRVCLKLHGIGCWSCWS